MYSDAGPGPAGDGDGQLPTEPELPGVPAEPEAGTSGVLPRAPAHPEFGRSGVVEVSGDAAAAIVDEGTYVFASKIGNEGKKINMATKI